MGLLLFYFISFGLSFIIAKKSLTKKHLSLIAATGWLIISTILLTLPGTTFPEENWLDKIWFDKWVHVGMFSVMTVLWCWYWFLLKKNVTSKKLRKIFITIGIAWLCYGIAMEFVQRYCIPNRSFDIGDIIADGTGCLLGMLFSIRRYKKN